MTSYEKLEHSDHVILIWLTTGILGVLGWTFFQNRYKTATRGDNNTRVLAPSAVARVALDPHRVILTPDHLAWFGSPVGEAGHVTHKVKYPCSPGEERERLIYGAPMACVTNSVPRSLRGWLFQPPSEEDY